MPIIANYAVIEENCDGTTKKVTIGGTEIPGCELIRTESNRLGGYDLILRVHVRSYDQGRDNMWSRAETIEWPEKM